MESKLEQESGDNSTNLQIGGNVHIGITASEARQIALDVFKANFYEFSEKAAKKAIERAEELTDEFIQTFYSKIPQLENKLEEPAVQSSMFNTQKEYAKTGDKDLKNQLLDLLIQRINSDERSLKQIVLDEAIQILPKLTKDQINILTLIFSAIYFNHRDVLNIGAFQKLLKEKLLRFYPSNKASYSFFTHLQFTGCCTLLSEGSSYKPLEEIFKTRYKAFFVKGFTIEDVNKEFEDKASTLTKLIMRCMQNPIALQFNPLNDEVFRQQISDLNLGEIGNKAMAFQDKYLMSTEEVNAFYLKIDDRTKSLFQDWREKDFKTIRPTSVGFAIAIMNYNRQTGSNIDFEGFI